MPFSEKKALAQEQLVSAYSLDYLTVVEYEQRIQDLQAADTFEAVERLVEDLPRDLVVSTGATPLAGRPTDVGLSEQVLEGSGQVVRKRGIWLRSNRIVINHRGSMIRLRMDELKELPNVQVKFEIDLQGSTLRISVPRGTRVIEDLQGHGSTVRISRRLVRSAVSYGPVVVLDGEVRNSMVRITPL
jgi:hypothetical protein